MPIKSYIAHPVSGRRNELIAALSDLPGCQVTPAENNPIKAVGSPNPGSDLTVVVQT